MVVFCPSLAGFLIRNVIAIGAHKPLPKILPPSLWMIFSRNTHKDAARLSLAKWYDRADRSGFKSFQAIISTLTEHHDGVLNFFVNRSTNAFAECFNAKIKQFRALLRGVIDIPFFLFRLTKIYA